MVANEKTFVYSMDTSTFHPHQAFVKFKAGFKNAIKTKQLELPKNVTDCFVYILVDDTNAGFKYDMVFNVPDSKFDIGIDKYATKTKYLKNANDLRKLGLSLNSTHRV
jgi:hypothetical protein